MNLSLFTDPLGTNEQKYVYAFVLLTIKSMAAHI